MAEGLVYTLDPHLATTLSEDRVLYNLFERLFYVDQGELRSRLVRSFEILEGNRTYQLTLNPWVWSDGRSLVCEDVHYSLARVPVEISGIQRLSCLDTRVLQLTLSQPSEFFLHTLTHLRYSIVPPHVIHQHSTQWTEITNLVVSGPYRVQAYEKQKFIHLTPNPFYPLSPISRSLIKIYLIADDQLAYYMFRNKEVDWVPFRFSSDWEWSASMTYTHPLYASYFYIFNLDPSAANHPLVEDLFFRRALMLAIDRRKLLQIIPPVGQIINSWLPTLPDQPGLEYPLFDLDEARRCLEHSSYALYEGSPLILDYNTQDFHKYIAEYLQQQWKVHLGVDVVLRNFEWKTFLERRSLGQFSLARMTWYGEYLDAGALLSLWMKYNPHNHVKYGNPHYDALVGDILWSNLIPSQRQEAIYQAEKMLLDHAVLIPLFSLNGIHWIHPSRLPEFQVNRLGLVYYAHLQK